ncbi:MAG: DUF3857 domain-containing protein, partial [Planctomycetes bacterium]|nr:DUF3857 domain-containing protein [Planctomycetota bacterium]
SNGDPFFSLMAARSVEAGVEGPEREENLRLVLLRSSADQGSVAALADIGRLYLDVMRHPRRADSFAEDALLLNPMSLRAGILDYDVAIAMGWKPVANQLLQKLVKQHPSSPNARLRQGRANLASGKYDRALAEFHAVLGVDADNREALDGAVLALGMLGQTSAAVDLLRSHLERFPYDSDARLNLAGLYRTLGRDEESLAVLAEALTLAPDDPEAASMRQDIARETFAEGKEAPVATSFSGMKQELDMSPPRRPVPNGWEYLYFQVEDRMKRDGTINRIVSFAFRVYTEAAARSLRHLGFTLEPGLENGTVQKLELVSPAGQRQTLSPLSQLHSDDRLLTFNLPPLQIGSTVEAEVEFNRLRIPFLGDYFGQIAPLTQAAPVRLSRYMFTAPKETRMHFRPVNGAPEAMVAESPDAATVTRIWEMTDLPAFVPEPHSPGQHALMPCVQMSSFGEWDEFARWYWRFFGGQYHTPPELRRLAHLVGRGDSLPLNKLDRAAEWISKNLGHREWEFGPYAFRPINARTILSRLTADGKDRTLLLCLLAREYGLQAWPVLARLRDSRYAATGSDDLALPLLENFNHSLVMVKTRLGGDIFLDASNPYRPPGVMPSQLFGSPGMAIMPDAAERVLIPDGGSAGGRWDEWSQLVVDEDGSVLWEQRIDGSGTAAETLRARFRDADARNDVWTGFLASIGATPSATATSFGEDSSTPASASFSGRARLRRYAAVDDERVVAALPPLPGTVTQATGRQAFPLSLYDFVRQGNRRQDLVLPYGFRLARRISVSYPEEWTLVNQPARFEREEPFGKISLAVESGPGALVLDFVIEVPNYLIKADNFDAFRTMTAQAEQWLRPVLAWEK